MIARKITAETLRRRSGDVRRHLRKSLKSFAETFCGDVAETAETPRQVIENIAETETETGHPLKGACAWAHTPARVGTRPRVANIVPKGTDIMKIRNAITPIGLPPVGLAIAINGQRFDCVAHEAYRRANGSDGAYAVWQAECAVCGQGFISRTIAGRFAETRRCELHRAPGQRVKSRRAN